MLVKDMISFMQWSFIEYERSAPGSGITPLWVRVASWLRNTALFEQAWTIVCDGPLRWWWSEQLCLFTVGFWTVFLLTKGGLWVHGTPEFTFPVHGLTLDPGREHNVKHVWAYMLLGQLVAISVATNLFFLALPPPPGTAENSKKSAERGAAAVSARRKMRTVPPVLWLSVLASLATVFLVPHSLRHDYFLSNLLVMHALLVIPLLLPLPLPVSAMRIGGPLLRLHIQTRTLYRLVALVAIIAHLRTTLSTDIGVVGAPGTLWAVLKSHPAQASIGWDVVWTTISFLMWVRVRALVTGTRLTVILTMILSTVIGSIGASGPVYMMMVL